MPRNKTRNAEAGSPEPDAHLPSLVVPGDDHRSKMYEKIATTHKQIVEAKWRAQTAGVQIQLTGNLLMHHEDAIAFLAEEVLRLQSQVESLSRS